MCNYFQTYRMYSPFQHKTKHCHYTCTLYCKTYPSTCVAQLTGGFGVTISIFYKTIKSVCFECDATNGIPSSVYAAFYILFKKSVSTSHHLSHIYIRYICTCYNVISPSLSLPYSSLFAAITLFSHYVQSTIVCCT